MGEGWACPFQAAGTWSTGQLIVALVSTYLRMFFLSKRLLTSNRQTGHSLLVWELEAESLRIMAEGLDIGHLQGNPSLITASENFLAVLGLCTRSLRVTVCADGKTSSTDSKEDRGEGLALWGFRRVATEALQFF